MRDILAAFPNGRLARPNIISDRATIEIRNHPTKRIKSLLPEPLEVIVPIWGKRQLKVSMRKKLLKVHVPPLILCRRIE